MPITMIQNAFLHAFRAFEFYSFHNISPFIFPQVGSFYVP